jgi:riboflavin synthase
MFTGILKSIGRIVQATPLGNGMRFRIASPELVRDLRVGESVSVNGVSQTVVERDEEEFCIETMAETLARSTMCDLHQGSHVNLEPALRLSDRLGGHLVEGNVECVGSVVVIERGASSWMISVEFPSFFGKYVVPAGSVAIDGISLPVLAAEANRLTVVISPDAMAGTTLSRVVLGSRVNLEFDLVGKYVERILKEGGGENLDVDLRRRLKAWGYTD